MNSPGPIAIRCRGLCKIFGDVPAVCGVNLEVRRGSFFALLGPSGCGKTTVLHIIAGLERPDSGEIVIGGQTVTSSKMHVPPERRKVGMVFQEYALFPHLAVAENVAYGLSGNGKDAVNRVREILTLVGLEGVRERMPNELSGGQQQRVALARALAPGPDVILLDEPFSNLDATLRSRVRADVRHILRQAEVTAIFVTHDQEEALSLADELAVMIDGKVQQSDTPQYLYHHPETHQVATFLGDTNFLPGRGKGLAVECELGKLTSKKEAAGDVEIMFRPEDLVLIPNSDGIGKIVETEYFGHDQLIHVELKTGTRLKSRLLGTEARFEAGQRVGVRLDKPVTTYPSPYGCPIFRTPDL